MKDRDNQQANAVLKKSYRLIYDKCIVKAKKIIPDKNKINKTIKKAGRIFEKLHKVPRLNKFTTNICNFCDLLSDYFDGVYTRFPVNTVIVLLAGLLYVVLPTDVLMDFLPVLGWIDDAAVLNFILHTEQKEISEYLAWKNTVQFN